MTQNTSMAVMAKRGTPMDALDLFPTPAWATRALCEFLKADDSLLNTRTCWEPACGLGHMVRPLREYFSRVHASDVHDYGAAEQERVTDFLIAWDRPPTLAKGVDWIITNPPFVHGAEFALVGFREARRGVALLVRTAFLESRDRYENLFQPYPPNWILQFAERVPMVKGRLDKTASTATAYCWVVWFLDRAAHPTRFYWIPPCRARLERAEDYDG